MFARTALLATALAVTAALPARAAMTAEEEAAFRQNCTGDYMRWCAMYDPDSPQVEQCFAAKAKSKELTQACANTIATVGKTVKRR